MLCRFWIASVPFSSSVQHGEWRKEPREYIYIGISTATLRRYEAYLVKNPLGTLTFKNLSLLKEKIPSTKASLGWYKNRYLHLWNTFLFLGWEIISSYWAAKQQISWVIAPWWIFIPFFWPIGFLLLLAPSNRSERHLHFASIKLCQASWMWNRFSR